MMRSCSCSSVVACVMAMPGSAVGMYKRRAFIKRRHELAAQLECQRKRHRQKKQVQRRA